MQAMVPGMIPDRWRTSPAGDTGEGTGRTPEGLR